MENEINNVHSIIVSTGYNANAGFYIPRAALERMIKNPNPKIFFSFPRKVRKKLTHWTIMETSFWERLKFLFKGSY